MQRDSVGAIKGVLYYNTQVEKENLLVADGKNGEGDSFYTTAAYKLLRGRISKLATVDPYFYGDRDSGLFQN
ncbi:hypothetical protein MIDIC_70019 [Alphaproteobacteria bacterium]